METTLTVTEAARAFSDLINRVVYRGDTAILTRNGSVVARIVPEPRRESTGLDLAAALESAPRLSPEEASAFADDIEAARRSLNGQTLPDPWGE